MKLLITAISGIFIANAPLAAQSKDLTPKQNFDQAKTDCAEGIMAACNNVGASYGRGFGTKKNIQKAQEFYTKACFGDIGDACNNLALMYNNKRELGINHERARGFMKKGCDLKSVNACSNLASFLRGGIGGEKDLINARVISQNACENGAPQACVTIGLMALNGEGGNKDIPLAVKTFDEGCKKEIGQACNNVAVMVSQGNGVKTDPEKAFNIFRRSCALSYAPGCKNYALQSLAVNKEDELSIASGDRILLFGEAVAEQGHQDKSLNLFKQACDKNAGKACFYVGLSYLNGLHGEKDRAKAKTMFDRGCDIGNLQSCNNKLQMEQGKL